MKGGAVKIKDWGKEKDLKRNRREGVGGAAVAMKCLIEFLLLLTEEGRERGRREGRKTA